MNVAGSVSGPLAALERRVAEGALAPDPAQHRAAAALQDLHDRLRETTAADGLFGRLRGLLGKAPEPQRGLYIHGPVGRGKSMLMDLFFADAPLRPKRRVHFHAFMQEAHDLIHRWRTGDRAWAVGRANGDDPIPAVAARVAQDARLLCFDEFQVTDVADAMILGRLFSALFGLGVVVVATSNVPPDRLYEGGLNRQLFLPFIALLKQRMAVCHLHSPTDWRLREMDGEPSYFTPLDDAADARMDVAWDALTGGDERRATLTVKGRKLTVPRAATGAARFSFADLCERALGAPDYLALAARYEVMFLDRIPRLKPEQRNAARRLIVLIDALYDARVRLFCSAAEPPDRLYPEGDGAAAFARTASRLVEMTAPEWPNDAGNAGYSSSGGVVGAAD